METGSQQGGRPAICLAWCGSTSDRIRLLMQADAVTPERLEVAVKGVHATIIFRSWQIDTPSSDELFCAAMQPKTQQVPAGDLVRMGAAAFNFAGEYLDPAPQPVKRQGIEIIARDPAGHGLLCRSAGNAVLIVDGTPEQMGTAHGRLLRESIRGLTERVVYGVGAADSLATGVWFFNRVAEIERQARPHVPARFLVECDALALASGVSSRDALAANLFPERFHCSGVAVCGKATADGRILHARVLDYMRDIGLQNFACVTVFLPRDRNAWISGGYAGFVGTVTAMNEHGLAVGEVGGSGEGRWDGLPMSFMLRVIMERATTVEDA